MITSITLDQLSCNTETEGGGSHPYLWAVLLQVDDQTIASGALVAQIAFAPSPTGAQIIIAEGMRAGGTAPVPAPQQRLAAQFDPGQERRDLILITVLWDQHDLPLTPSSLVTTRSLGPAGTPLRPTSSRWAAAPPRFSRRPSTR